MGWRWRSVLYTRYAISLRPSPAVPLSLRELRPTRLRCARIPAGTPPFSMRHSPWTRLRSSRRTLRVCLGGSDKRSLRITACRHAEELIGPSLASALGWVNCALLRLSTASGQLAAVLCLANLPKDLSVDDQQFLQAMAQHASVALENSRLFTRMDHANRHWMEIFDAITDFIVAHDEPATCCASIVLWPNSSVCRPSRADRSEHVGPDFTGRDRSACPCPFCRRQARLPTNTFIPVLERTYLVSTSRCMAIADEGLQTIHVLKDITDRREAEHRYRELFDNIQEGLFFSTAGRAFHRSQRCTGPHARIHSSRRSSAGSISRTRFISRPSSAMNSLATQMQQHGVHPQL